jgi:glycosyltransferase involved in cell wall biosynthesis
LSFSKEESLEYAKKYIELNQGDIFATSVGFLSTNKRQEDTLDAVIKIAKKISNFKFLMIGSTGRRPTDVDYYNKLKEKEINNVKVVNRFLGKDEIAKLMIASDFGIYGYEPTHYSTSGISHLVQSYGVPTVSSTSLILEDLKESMSIKCYTTNEFEEGIRVLVSDEAKRNQLGMAAFDSGVYTRWDKTAKTHMRAYEIIGEWK